MPRPVRRMSPAAPAAPGAPASRSLARDHPILDPIITMNGGGITQSASDSVEQVSGWPPGEFFGRIVKMLIPEPRRSALDRYLDRYRLADRTDTLKQMR